MANRALLHRNKLKEFKEWLIKDQGLDVLTLAPRAGFEVLRWKNAPSKPMCIIYDRLEGDHYTVNNAAVPFVTRWLRRKYEAKFTAKT